MSDSTIPRYLNARLTRRKKYGSSHLFTARIIENENRIGRRDETSSSEQPNENGFGSKSSSDFYDGASRKGLGYAMMGHCGSIMAHGRKLRIYRSLLIRRAGLR